MNFFFCQMVSLLKTHALLKIINNAIVDLPTPRSISLWWNYGSLLGVCLITQILTGLFLAIHYCGDTLLAFERVSHISRDVNWGWALRTIHANGASLFFMCLFTHVGRGLYYGSFNFHLTWIAGVTILLLTIAAAFLGYVLPWGQISFWGATVITNLFSAIPFIGNDVVTWLWGGFAVDNATLTRFFAFHFLVPFIIAALVIVHLLFLHQTGSNNPLGIHTNLDKIPFHPYFTTKDRSIFILSLIILSMLVMLNPWLLGDPENFIPANPLVTPVHIQPEWYFLFAYAVLRSIPNKLGGVVALAASVLILYTIPLLSSSKFQRVAFYPLRKWLFWTLVRVILILTWIGARPVEAPFIGIGQSLTCVYFSLFLLPAYAQNLWDKILEF